MNPMLNIDGYKFDHRRQYKKGVRRVNSNFTPRMSRVEGQKKVFSLGLQGFIQKYLMEIWQKDFFDQPVEKVCQEYQDFINGYLGPNSIGTDHIRALHELGYMPLEFKALPEGTAVPLRVPMFTVENTHNDFAWLTNYIETLLSCVIWPSCTSATTASRARKLLEQYAVLTGSSLEFVDWQGHDFSFRGMMGPEAAQLSGVGHLLFFTGTDSCPAVPFIQRYYDGAGLIGGSVAATEHSVASTNSVDNFVVALEEELDDFLQNWKVVRVLTQIEYNQAVV